MAHVGQRAAVLCTAGDNLIYTVDAGNTENLSLSFSSSDGSALTFKVYHVKQGKQGNIAHGDKDLLGPPLLISMVPVVLKELIVSSLDDLVVNVDVGSKLVVNVNNRRGPDGVDS